MRRLFIIRKDLNLSHGKMSAMVGHCAEAYWTNLFRNAIVKNEYEGKKRIDSLTIKIDGEIMDNYINDAFVKTICEAKNLNHLKKVILKAEELGLKEGIDFGLINDKCLTELSPENEDGTCTVGIWFKPLNDDVAHILSKKYQLYKG